jgi:hypothetical protein
MSNFEDNIGHSEEVPVEQTAQNTGSDIYLSTKMATAMSAGLAFIANVESIAGSDTASTATLRTAGALAVGAAMSGAFGFVKSRRKD